MKKPGTLFIGLDVHKDSISVAHAPDDRGAEVTYVGRIGTRTADVDALVRRLQATAGSLVFVYEAVPCGYVLHRHLSGRWFDCLVVAPSLIPRKLASTTRASSPPSSVSSPPSTPPVPATVRAASPRS